MSRTFELVKINVQPVVQVREDGIVVDDIAGQPTPVFAKDAKKLAGVWADAEREVEQLRAQEAAQNGNRAQRRNSRKPKEVAK